jgi:hypothetical protein
MEAHESTKLSAPTEIDCRKQEIVNGLQELSSAAENNESRTSANDARAEREPGPGATGAEDSALLRRLRDRTFRTLDGKAFIAIDAVCGRRIVPIQSRSCRQWVGFKLEEESGKRPSQAELRSTCDRLEVYASDAPVADVHVRVALAGGRIYIDLADDRGRVVEIGPDGWRVIDTAPVHFIRTPSMQPLPIPVRGGSIDDLRSFLNVDDDDFVLIVGCLLNGFRGGRSHPVLVLTGAAGTAKSTQLAILNCLIDPQPIGGLPATERQLRNVSDRHLFAFDNVSPIPRPVADALCRLSYTHPVIINCIEDVVTCPGLADRGVFATCNSIPDERRRTEEEVWAEFERSHPRILGALLDAAAHGLRSLPTTRPDKLPRLADFARWVTACEGDLWPQGTFVAAYTNNRAEAAEKLMRLMSWRLPCRPSWPIGRLGRERRPSWIPGCGWPQAISKAPRAGPRCPAILQTGSVYSRHR